MKKIYLVIPLVLFIGDRVIKYFAPSINFEGGFVKIGLYTNFSGAFSLPISGIIYNVVGVILLLVFVVLFIKEINKKNYKKLLAIELILLGGISNVGDRIWLGHVVDYIQVLDRSFFNLADVMLIGGVGILLMIQFKKKKV